MFRTRPAFRKVLLILVAIALGIAVFLSCKREKSPPTYTPAAPIVISYGQLAALAESVSSDELSRYQPVVQIFANTDDGIVVLFGSTTSAWLHTMPEWINVNGTFITPPITKRYDLSALVWNRKGKPSDVPWLTSKQVLTIHSLVLKKENLLGKTTKIAFLKRTAQGVVIRFEGSQSRIQDGDPTCIDDHGEVVKYDSAIEPSELSWFETIKRQPK